VCGFSARQHRSLQLDRCPAHGRAGVRADDIIEFIDEARSVRRLTPRRYVEILAPGALCRTGRGCGAPYLGIHGTKERIHFHQRSSADTARTAHRPLRLHSNYGYTETKVTENLAADAERGLLNRLPTTPGIRPGPRKGPEAGAHHTTRLLCNHSRPTNVPYGRRAEHHHEKMRP
jgi:hypothetical protein